MDLRDLHKHENERMLFAHQSLAAQVHLHIISRCVAKDVSHSGKAAAKACHQLNISTNSALVNSTLHSTQTHLNLTIQHCLLHAAFFKSDIVNKKLDRIRPTGTSGSGHMDKGTPALNKAPLKFRILTTVSIVKPQ